MVPEGPARRMALFPAGRRCDNGDPLSGNRCMKLLYDLFPLLVFFAVFKLYGIYPATAAGIAASALQVAAYWLRHRRFETLHLFTLGAITVLGGLTLALQDERFIKWKPTLVNWVFAAVVLGSHGWGRRPIMERLLAAQMRLPPPVWRRLNLSWGIFFLLAGALNLYVAFWFGPDLDADLRREIWVNFKVFGLLGLTLAFALGQALFLARHLQPDEPGDGA